jgi:uncharacterized membrane protein
MQSRARILGEQLNPLLTVLPLGILGTALLCDLGALMSGVHFFGRVALWDMGAGLVVGLLALCGLLVDLVTAPPASFARRIVGVVTLAVASMIVLFGIVWSVRMDTRATGTGPMFLVELIALGAGIAGVWMARGLVIGHGLHEPTPARAAALRRSYTVPLRPPR